MQLCWRTERAIARIVANGWLNVAPQVHVVAAAVAFQIVGVEARDTMQRLVGISHQMEHVMEVADRAVVLRRGRVVGNVVPTKETHEEIVSYMLSG